MTNLITLSAPREQIKPAQFTVDGPTFAEAIAPAVKVAKNAGQYAAVTLSFRDQRVTVAATDFETSITTKVPVKGKKATNVAVAPDRLAKFGKLFPLGDVTIDVSPNGVQFQVGQTVLTMPPVFTPPAVDIPAFTAPADAEIAKLLAAVRVVAPSASTDDARLVLTGVLFDNGNAVATDSYRLAVYRAAPAGLTGLFPAKALQLAAKVFGDVDAAEYEIVDRKLVLRTADRAMSIRSIDGEYPNWKNLMTTATPSTVVKVGRKAFMSALDRVQLGGDGKDSVCRAQVESETLFLTVQLADVAEALDPIPVDVDGDLALVGFNAGYTRSVLAGVDSEVIAIRFLDAMKPFTIVDADGGSDYELLQMPVRLP